VTLLPPVTSTAAVDPPTSPVSETSMRSIWVSIEDDLNG